MSNRPNYKGRNARPINRQSVPRSLWSQWRWLGTAAAIVAVLAIAIALMVAGGGDDDGTSNETAFAEILGEPLAPFANPDAAVGQQAPRVSAQALDGDRLVLGNDGTARIYGFFAHWCPHCQEDLPRAAAWLESTELPAGVQVVAVSTAVDPQRDNYPPSAWFAREEWPVVAIMDDESGSLATGFGLTGFPYWVAVDGDGTVVSRLSGEATVDQLNELVAAVL